jgi:hypothetical protein
VPGDVGIESVAALPALTVNVPVEPVTEPWVAVSEVACASKSVTEAEPTPLEKLTDEG